LIRLFIDLYNFIRLKRSKTVFRIGFFSENNFIYEYLEPYILRKMKKHKILILSFEDINRDYLNLKNVFIFKTKLFQEIVFLTLNLKYLYSSTPDLNFTIFKKSKFSKCKYIYLSHTPVSMNLIYRKNAFDHFDAVQATSVYQYKEMKEIIKKRNLKTKVFKSEYLFVKKQITKIKSSNFETDLLIAPSWNSNFYITNCHLILNKLLKEYKISFKLRPHPISFKKKEISLSELKKENIPVDNFIYIDFQKYNFLISDWSGIFIEYALIFRRRAFLINTRKKIVNREYFKLENKPIEISLRNTLARSFEISEIPEIIKEILSQKNLQKNKDSNNEIDKIIKSNFY